MIDLTSYQETIKQFYTPEVQADLLTYSRELLVSEVGEVIGLRAKRRRGDATYQDAMVYRAAVVLEMGDVLFALASIATSCEKVFEGLNVWCRPSIYLAEIMRDTANTVNAFGLPEFDSEAQNLMVNLWSYVMYAFDDGGTQELQEIIDRNIEKLQVRAANNLIRGSGHGEERR
jgi:NTP pyrophosphatase (non-canonical NTP hydrolase)